MGNVQCHSSSVYDNEFDLVVTSTSGSSPSKDWGKGNINRRPSCYSAKSSDGGDFLRPHLPEKPHKWILDPSDVTNALVEQAEELLYRQQQKGHASTFFVADENVWAANDECLADDLTASRARSDVAPSSVAAATEFTTFSAATRQVANVRRFRGNTKDRYRCKSVTAPPPKLKGGNNFVANESFRQEIHNIVSSQSESTELRRGQLGEIVLNTESFTFLAPCTTIELNTSFSDEIREHASALHLKIMPQCVKFYQQTLSRNLPHNSVTRAFRNSIINTRLAPSQPQRDLGVSSTVSSMTSSDEVDFAVTPPSSSVRLLTTNSVLMDLAVTGSLGLVPRKTDHNALVTRNKALTSPSHYSVLINRRSGIPLALCATRAGTTGPPVVRVYTTKRHALGQVAAASTKRLGLNWTDSLPLYSWAEIVTEGRYPGRVCYSIYMASGSNGRFEKSPSYRAIHDANLSSDIRVVGRTEREQTYSGCAVLSLCRNDDDREEDDDVYFRLSVSRGIDPALFICFAALVDESLEKTMRLQCQLALAAQHHQTIQVTKQPPSAVSTDRGR